MAKIIDRNTPSETSNPTKDQALTKFIISVQAVFKKSSGGILGTASRRTPITLVIPTKDLECRCPKLKTNKWVILYTTIFIMSNGKKIAFHIIYHAMFRKYFLMDTLNPTYSKQFIIQNIFHIFFFSLPASLFRSYLILGKNAESPPAALGIGPRSIVIEWKEEWYSRMKRFQRNIHSCV